MQCVIVLLYLLPLDLNEKNATRNMEYNMYEFEYKCMCETIEEIRNLGYDAKIKVLCSDCLIKAKKAIAQHIFVHQNPILQNLCTKNS